MNIQRLKHTHILDKFQAMQKKKKKNTQKTQNIHANPSATHFSPEVITVAVAVQFFEIILCTRKCLHEFFLFLFFSFKVNYYLVIPGGSDGKQSACNAGDLGSIPGLGRFTWRRAWQPNSSILLEWRIPMDRGAWWATVYGVTKSRTRLSPACLMNSETLINVIFKM